MAAPPIPRAPSRRTPWVENRDTGERLRVAPGELRQREVMVGRHLPHDAADLSRFLARFEEAHNPARLTQLRQVETRTVGQPLTGYGHAVAVSQLVSPHQRLTFWMRQIDC